MELYVNLAAVNHGSHGGSLAWTPRRRDGKKILTLEGDKQFLLADVRLPVKSLAEAQAKGPELARDKAMQEVESWFEQKEEKTAGDSLLEKIVLGEVSIVSKK